MSQPASLEEQLADRIRNSSLSVTEADPVNGPKQGVYIGNPVASIQGRAGERFGKPKISVGPVDVVPGPDMLLPKLSPTQSKALGYGDNPKPYEQRVDDYLKWGEARAREQPFIGVCESFNCIVLAMLTAKNSPLHVGDVVEYIGVKHTAVGHAICAIYRSNQTEEVGQAVPVPDDWGADCIVVDQWYALQAACEPVFHVAGPQADATYVAWLKSDSPSFKLYGRIVVDGKRRAIPKGKTARPF